MEAAHADPVQALALLPLEQGEEMDRQWLQSALVWLKSVPPELRSPRLRLLAEGLSAPPLAMRFRRIWTQSSPAALFSEAGIAEEISLSHEFLIRFRRSVLPQLDWNLDLYDTLRQIRLEKHDADWIETLSDSDAAPWTDVLGSPAPHIAAALRLLAIRASAIGLSRTLIMVIPSLWENETPFYDLVDIAARYGAEMESPGNLADFEAVLLKCKMSTGVAHARLDETGVSSDLVFRLDLLAALLERMELLLRVASGREDARKFTAQLVCGFVEERGIRSLIRNGVNRVARQVVQHTGRTGEHYIASSAGEWRKMGFGAIGAGAITAFTALFKYALIRLPLAPLWIGVAHSLNYTVSFVLMQLLGWRLASKMPSMTAAALADALEKEDGMRAEIRLVAAISRTQCVVTIGNLLGAIPMSFLVDWIFRWTRAHPFLSVEAGMHGIESMNPIHSATIFYAAVTGCFLWLSSLAAGWTGNWMVIHRLPAALGRSRRIHSFLGPRAALRLEHLVEHHLSGVAGYACLGLLLGLLPFVSVFVGLPIEVRHITLASAALSYDVDALIGAGRLPWGAIGWSLAGLAVTAVMNIGVSFALGLWLAMRARSLDARRRRRLVGVLLRNMLRKPAQYLWKSEPLVEAE